MRQGLSVNEYGIKNTETDETEFFTDESCMYERLGLQYIPHQSSVAARTRSNAPEGVPSPGSWRSPT